MKISAKTDYALRVIFELALNYEKFKMGKCYRLSNIAKKHNIPIKFLHQIIFILKRNGFVNTRQGINGGIYLSKNPNDINLLDVIEAIEDNIFQIVCFNENFYRKCKNTDCFFRDMWLKIKKTIEEEFSKISFEDIILSYKNNRGKLNYYI